MPEGATAIVRRAFEAVDEEGGVEATLRYVAEDAVIHPFPEWMEKSRYEGHDGWRELLAGWTESFDDFALAPEEFRDAGGGLVVVLGWNTGRIKGTSTPIKQPVGAVFRVRDELICEMRYFLTWDEALAATQ